MDKMDGYKKSTMKLVFLHPSLNDCISQFSGLLQKLSIMQLQVSSFVVLAAIVTASLASPVPSPNISLRGGIRRRSNSGTGTNVGIQGSVGDSWGSGLSSHGSSGNNWGSDSGSGSHGSSGNSWGSGSGSYGSDGDSWGSGSGSHGSGGDSWGSGSGSDSQGNDGGLLDINGNSCPLGWILNELGVCCEPNSKGSGSLLGL
ncbi:hypothetical protein GYMLUDRAFT_254623 [Collybiopsis luxurians FD-317 M1]|nr:hypothetical protein GYMLUDRAFT_254623 [Collybiopsis luxurians FD-317 M1]